MPELIDLIDRDAARIVDAIDLSPLDGSSILITGASGLLGTYLLATFRRWMRVTGASAEVIAVTRSAPPPAVASFIDGRRIRLQQADLADSDAVRALPAAHNVIHAAGYGQPGKFLENPVKTIRINTVATMDLLEKLPADGRFLFLSSSEIYSGSPHVPHRETDIGTTDPAHPRACYIEGKRCGEAICHAYQAQGRNTKSARLALAYGPGTRSDDQRVLNSFIRRALLDRRLELLDRGAARRTYCYITDAVWMLLSIMLYGREAVYNVGGQSSLTILELARAVAELVGVPVTVPPEEKEAAGAPSDVALDLTRVCGEFNKTTFVTMEEGLRETIEWQRHLYGVAA